MNLKWRCPYISGMAAFCLCISLAACATQSASDTAPNLIQGAVGMKKPDSAVAAGRQKSVGIRVDAAKDLNADKNGRGLATVIRLYKLRDPIGFLAAPDSAFGTAQHDKQMLGNDLIEARELTLAPGQRLDLTERLGGDAAYLGIVALFHSPTPQRWRFAFAAEDAERSGIAVGIHTCAMTATKATPVGMSPNEAALLSPVKCK